MLVLSRKQNEQLVVDSRAFIRDLVMRMIGRHESGATPSQIEQEILGLVRPVTVAIVEIRGDKVRLGIDGQKEVACHRREVFDAIERQGGIDNQRPRH